MPRCSPVQWALLLQHHGPNIPYQREWQALALTIAQVQMTPQPWLPWMLLWENANVTFAAYLLWANTRNKKPQIIPGYRKDNGSSAESLQESWGRT